METTKSTSLVPMMIIGTFVLFAAFIFSMVYRASQTDINLVREDYYQQTLHHDEHVASVARSASEDIVLRFNKSKEQLEFNVPAELASTVTGNIHFYRPSDAKLDFLVPIQLKEGAQVLSLSELKSGNWMVKVTFTANEQPYFKEIALMR